jgi:histone H3/H4
MVRRRAEDYVRGEGRLTVTAEDLDRLRRQRFGDGAPPMPPPGARAGK